MLTVVNEDGTTPHGSLIDEIVREGARRMPAAALEAEVNAYINAYISELADQQDDSGRRLVVRNGFHQPRKMTTSAGAIEVKSPRVNDKRADGATGERKRFSSAILPRSSAWVPSPGVHGPRMNSGRAVSPSRPSYLVRTGTTHC